MRYLALFITSEYLTGHDGVGGSIKLYIYLGRLNRPLSSFKFIHSYSEHTAQQYKQQLQPGECVWVREPHKND